MTGFGGDKVGIIYNIYPWALLGIWSLSYFLSVGYSSKPSHYSLTFSLIVHHINEFFKKNMDGR